MSIYIYPILVILYIISEFVSISAFPYIIGIAANVTILYSLFFARGLYLFSGIGFYVIGLALFISIDLPWHSFFLHFESMLGILSLFLVLPFLNSLIRLGRYDKNLSLFIEQGVPNLGRLYKRSFIVCHILGLFLNIATLPLLLRTLNKTLDPFSRKLTDKYYTQNLLRAYALCLTWSPLEIMVITSLDITGKSYLYVFPIIFSIAIIVILSDWMLSKFKFKAIPLEATNDTIISYKKIYKKIAELFFMLIVLVCIVSIFNYTFNKTYLFSIVLLIIPISILWALLIRKLKRYFSIAIPHWKERTRGLSNYFFMFLSAGLFVQMLSLTQVFEYLQTAFVSVSEQTILFYLLVAAFFLTFSFIGFHPLVAIVLLAEIIAPILPEVASISLAIVLISCSLSTVMYSPFNISVSILSNHLRVNPYRLGMWNIGFAIGYMLFTISVATLLDVIL